MLSLSLAGQRKGPQNYLFSTHTHTNTRKYLGGQWQGPQGAESNVLLAQIAQQVRQLPQQHLAIIYIYIYIYI
jgi:hypothetical protein